jgi:hypothetical protein
VNLKEITHDNVKLAASAYVFGNSQEVKHLKSDIEKTIGSATIQLAAPSEVVISAPLIIKGGEIKKLEADILTLKDNGQIYCEGTLAISAGLLRNLKKWGVCMSNADIIYTAPKGGDGQNGGKGNDGTKGAEGGYTTDWKGSKSYYAGGTGTAGASGVNGADGGKGADAAPATIYAGTLESVLTISIFGGVGGTGGNGGDGGAGGAGGNKGDGSDAGSGGAGGNGGTGGKGGDGGSGPKLTIITPLQYQKNFVISANPASGGSGGVGGKGGVGGSNGSGGGGSMGNPGSPGKTGAPGSPGQEGSWTFKEPSQ